LVRHWFLTRNEWLRQTFLAQSGRAPRQLEVFMRKILSLAVVAGALAISACNTVEGVGKDVSSAGNAVAGAANDTK